MRLGILGGTFDPPHVGHLLAASDAFEALSLDLLLFVPAATQPLKIGAVHATADQRVAMLELLIAGDPRLAVDRIEIDRGGLSYTVDTLAELRRTRPDAEQFWLIGEDLVAQLPRWRDPERIAQLATIVILRRAASPREEGDRSGAGIPLTWLETRRVDISSTEIRERVREGLPIHGFVPDAVAAYIAAAGLYR
ncbi:MAG: nicotinate-nucleotide adenylyltransferase [Gemmatimonadota bacterium]|nr:nicotinate-nucleotide adenylyltransferase [Gemmatimonadota bacterium]